MHPKVNDHVEKIANDYTGGRKGFIIEIKDGRARVHWKKSASGLDMNIKTWNKFDAIKVTECSWNYAARNEFPG